MDKVGAEPNYDRPSLHFYDELHERHLTRLGASSESRETNQSTECKGGFYPTYEEIVTVLLTKQAGCIYQRTKRLTTYK